MRGRSAQAPFWSLPVIYPLVFDGSIGSPPPCWQESGAGEWFTREIPAPRSPTWSEEGYPGKSKVQKGWGKRAGLPGMLRHTGQCKWLPDGFRDPERSERQALASARVVWRQGSFMCC